MIRVVPSPSRVLTRLVRRPARRSSSRELLGLVLLDDLGRDDLEDPAAQDPQLPRTEVRRLRHQMRLGPGQQLGRDLVGRAAPPARARSPAACARLSSPLGERGGHLAPAPIQRLGERQVAPVGARSRCACRG